MFYCRDDYAHSLEGKQKIEGVEYGCFEFWGRENGKSFYLSIPDTHSVLDRFKYQGRIKIDGIWKEFACYDLKEKFLIKGVEKLK